MTTSDPHPWCPYIKPIWDLVVTLSIWFYFTVGFVVLFSPFYLAAYPFTKNREIRYQRLNHYFYRGLFLVARTLGRGHKWRIDDGIRSIRSAVVVCNHQSYLDPLLLISLLERQKTIVKSSFFKVPIFSQMLQLSGYLPSVATGKLSDLMIRRIEEMDAYLAAGGNLFIFPEGTRSRNGRIGALNRGAFKIAKRCNAPIEVLSIRNTDKLMQPGRFRFHTCIDNTIVVEHVAGIMPDYQSETFSVSGVMARVREMLQNQQPTDEAP